MDRGFLWVEVERVMILALTWWGCSQHAAPAA